MKTITDKLDFLKKIFNETSAKKLFTIIFNKTNRKITVMPKNTINLI